MAGLQQITHGPAAHYPLYFFVPSHGANEQHLVVHRVQNADVQLVRIDLATLQVQQISNGTSRNCGWDIWSEPAASGIYDHLSCLSRPRDEVYWFEDRAGLGGDCEVWAAGITSLSRRRLTQLPGRIPVGQGACSPDGRWLGIIHADHDSWRATVSGRHPGLPDHEEWRKRTAVDVGLIDLDSGAYHKVLANSFHMHHLDFVDNQTLLFNHLAAGNGAWTINIEGQQSSIRIIRPPEDGMRICHQQITATGIHYEGFKSWTGDHPTWAGRSTWPDGSIEEFLLPLRGYSHTARDPLGRRAIYETASSTAHLLFALQRSATPAEPAHQVLHHLAPYPASGQRYHAHPFIDPSGNTLYFTDCPEGIPQVFSLPLAGVPEFWS